MSVIELGMYSTLLVARRETSAVVSWRPRGLVVMKCADDGVGHARLTAAMVEIEALRAEVEPLRPLLGLDRDALNASAAALWESTRFAEATTGMERRRVRARR